jgi:mono/diheme cytochrome c family protein
MRSTHAPLWRLGTVAAVVALAVGSLPAQAAKGGPKTVLQAEVRANAGGTFSDNPADPAVVVTIPPGALSRDATLRVRLVNNPPAAGAGQVAASPAYDVQLTPRGAGRGKLLLRQPMRVEIDAAPLPQLGQIGEIATRQGSRWERLGANLYKPGAQSVVGLTSETNATYRVTHRQLHLASGPTVASGRELFMYETFGNEGFFGDVVGLDDLLNNVAPVDAVALGVQVDITRVPQPIVDVMVGPDLDAKAAALQDPAVTRALIKAGAVVGVRGFYADPASDVMSSAGITCGLCHVKVEPTVFELPGGPTPLPIGVPQFDGVPNNGLDAGGILALTPGVRALGLDALLAGWGPGRFDVRALDVDLRPLGIDFVDNNPLEDGVDNPTTYPPIWNFLDLSRQGYTIGWDGLFKDNGVDNRALASISEAVYDLIFHGNGAFGVPPFVIDGGNGGTIPPELAITPPGDLVTALIQAEINRPGNEVVPPAKLLELQAFMQSIPSPLPAAGDFDEAMAEQGLALFHGKANCAACHRSPELTGPGLFKDITAQPPQGGLAAGIKVPGLRGVATAAPHFHDGSAADLAAVVARFVERGQVPGSPSVPALSPAEQAAIVEYLKSL